MGVGYELLLNPKHKEDDEIWNKIIYEKQKECMNCFYRIRCETHGNYLCLKHIHEDE